MVNHKGEKHQKIQEYIWFSHHSKEKSCPPHGIEVDPQNDAFSEEPLTPELIKHLHEGAEFY